MSKTIIGFSKTACQNKIKGECSVLNKEGINYITFLEQWSSSQNMLCIKNFASYDLLPWQLYEKKIRFWQIKRNRQEIFNARYPTTNYVINMIIIH